MRFFKRYTSSISSLILVSPCMVRVRVRVIIWTIQGLTSIRLDILSLSVFRYNTFHKTQEPSILLSPLLIRYNARWKRYSLDKIGCDPSDLINPSSLIFLQKSTYYSPGTEFVAQIHITYMTHEMSLCTPYYIITNGSNSTVECG